MLESFLDQEKAVKLYCIKHDTPETLTKADWDLIAPTVYLLKPMRDVSMSLSSGGLISQAYPKLRGLQVFFSKAQASENPHTKGVRGGLAVGLSESLKKRFSDIFWSLRMQPA